MIFSRVSALLCLLALPTVACGVTHGEDATTTDDSSELRRLLPAEVVGSIAYGQTKTVSYTSEPRYRAFSFQATQGDSIDARFVGAKGLDTVGFLLSDSFATVAQNDDETAATRSSRITFTIKTTGTYYLAVREANEEDGDITISLAKVGGAQPPAPPKEEPPTPAEVFNPKSCTGNVFTQARAIKYFPKGAANGSVTISDKPGRAYLRARVCSEFSGCADWVEKDVTQPQNTGALRGNGANTAAGILQLNLSDRANDPIDVYLTVSNGTQMPNFGGYYLTTHRLALKSYTAPTTVRTTSYQSYSQGFGANAESWTPANASLDGYVELPVAEANLNLVPLTNIDWQTTLTETCAQARFSTVKVSAGQQQRVEMQGVIHWDLTTPAN